MFLTLTLFTMAIAGFAVCWRNLLNDIPQLSNFVDKFPYVIRKALKCGFCSTFWFGFIALLLADPLPNWTFGVRWPMADGLVTFIDFMATWMIVGIYAVIIRFAYVVLQELVHYQVHHLRNREHKH